MQWFCNVQTNSERDNSIHMLIAENFVSNPIQRPLSNVFIGQDFNGFKFLVHGDRYVGVGFKG